MTDSSVPVVLPTYYRRPMDLSSEDPVRAIQIREILPEDSGLIRMQFVDSGVPDKVRSALWATVHAPAAGDYYVVYKDGTDTALSGRPFEAKFSTAPPPDSSPDEKDS